MLIIFAVLLAVRINGIATRSQLHPDEIFSVMLAQRNPAYYTPLPDSAALTGAEIKTMLVNNNPLGTDLNGLYHVNHDDPHASLYYMALRVALSGLDSFDAGEVALRGGLLNLLFFAVAFFALWRTGRILFGDLKSGSLVTLAVMALAFGSKASVENTLFVREYQMAEMFICLTGWASAVICRNIGQRRAVTAPTWTAYTLAVAGAASTGYLNAFFVALLSVPMLWLAIAHKNGRAAVAVVLAPLMAVAVAFAAYQGYFNFLLHSNVHTGRAFEDFSNVPDIVFVKALYRDVLTLPGAILLGAMFLLALIGRERAEMIKGNRQWWIPLCAIAAMVLVEYASVLREERYIFPYLSSAALLAGVIISGIDIRLRNACAVVLGLYMLVMCPFNAPEMRYGWGYIRNELKDGAILYRLNPNELPQIAPVLNDTVSYRLTADTGRFAASDTLPVVSHVKPPLDTIAKKQHLTGPMYIYRR
ncbi:MAG: hypothetical protein ACI30N_07095 [Muribaculaceae bacterium]